MKNKFFSFHLIFLHHINIISIILHYTIRAANIQKSMRLMLEQMRIIWSNLFWNEVQIYQNRRNASIKLNAAYFTALVKEQRHTTGVNYFYKLVKKNIKSSLVILCYHTKLTYFFTYKYFLFKKKAKFIELTLST